MAQGIACKNPTCVINREPQGCQPGFTVLRSEEVSPTFACKYCGWQNAPSFYGMQQSGRLIYKPIRQLRYISQHQLHQFRFFSNEEEALKQGYVLSAHGSDGTSPVYEVER